MADNLEKQVSYYCVYQTLSRKRCEWCDNCIADEGNERCEYYRKMAIVKYFVNGQEQSEERVW